MGVDAGVILALQEDFACGAIGVEAVVAVPVRGIVAAAAVACGGRPAWFSGVGVGIAVDVLVVVYAAVGRGRGEDKGFGDGCS